MKKIRLHSTIKSLGSSKVRGFRKVLLPLIVLYSLSLSMPGLAAANNTTDSFHRVWQTTDQVVASGQLARTWMWGPNAVTTQFEDYVEAPGGHRLVEYFDKSRMEITNQTTDSGSPWYVSNGLLTKELVSGQMQVGDGQFVNRGAAQVPVAGDPDNIGPTYGSFQNIASLAGDRRANSAVGAGVVTTIGAHGEVGSSGNFDKYGVRIAAYNSELGHNIPNVLWSWMNSLSVNWVFALGYPISEPMWTQVRVGGQAHDVLIQLFERRVLTYSPTNDAAWRVEMGNIGRHYYQWRYGSPADQLNTEEKSSLDLINAERSRSGLAPLQIDATLTAIARARCNDMATKNYFSHQQPDGKTFKNYLNDYQVQWVLGGEIIAKTNASASQTPGLVMSGWMNSGTHNSVIHTGSYQTIGIGEAVDGAGNRYITAIFDQS